MNAAKNPTKTYLTLEEIAAATGRDHSVVAKQAKKEGWPFEVEPGSARCRRFATDTLPKSLKDSFRPEYLIDQSAALSQAELREFTKKTNEIDAAIDVRTKRAKRRKAEPLPPTDDEAAAIWAEYDRRATGNKVEAKRRFEIVRAFKTLRANDLPKMACYDAIEDKYGESNTTVWRWLNAVKYLDHKDWLPALAPKWNGKTAEAEFSEDAWAFIKADWGRQSQPALTSVYARAVELAKQHGWDVPSYDTVLRRINAQPFWWKKLTREGGEALAQCFPAAQRDYSTLSLHQLWVSDGRKADLFCRWPDGSVSRPIVVAWQEARSRLCLGFEIGRVENADLIRYSFRVAASGSMALPREALLDNGRGYASKLFTGGQPTRYRFKIKEEDIPGIITLLGVNVVWATPGHGQSKPIESWWRTIAQTDKRAEFQGAYCGNNPLDKPEDCDAKNAVPIEAYRAALTEDIKAYNLRPHRGDSMDYRSPLAVYEELLESTAIRRPTDAQLRLCLLAAESVRLNEDHSVTLLGNRYWTERLAELPHRGPYVVRFNPENANDAVAIYDGERFLCEAPLTAKTGFRDQEAAKSHNRARNQFVKAKKQEAQSIAQMDDALRWTEKGKDLVDTETGEIVTKLPSPKVAEPVRPTKDYRPSGLAQIKSADAAMTQAEEDEQMRIYHDRGMEKIRAASGGR